MLKTISICATLVFLGTGAANAQQREAVLKKLEVPGADFDLVVAMAKPGGAVFVQQGLPDPLVVNLVGTELAIAVDSDVAKMVKDIGVLFADTCATSAGRKNSESLKSVSVYVVPKGGTSLSSVR